ncbi:MAG: diguanylate cyclase domain-containing protein [Lachnospira eligens]
MKELPDKKKNRLIIYSDIAEFKLINEIFGIEKGNEILLKQADIIKTCGRWIFIRKSW